VVGVRLWVPCLVLGCVSTIGACSGRSSTSASSGSSTSSTPSRSAPTTTSGSGVSTSTTKAPQIESSPPGDIPDNQAYVEYSPPGSGYQIKVPEGWARSNVGSAVMFSDKYNTIRVELRAAAAAPTVASAPSELPALASSTLGYRQGLLSSVTRTAGPAVLITYQAASPPNDVTGKSVLLDVERYEFWAHGREAIITLSGSVGSDNVDPWRIVTNSFGWK
jgi:hypothetical protein